MARSAGNTVERHGAFISHLLCVAAFQMATAAVPRVAPVGRHGGAGIIRGRQSVTQTSSTQSADADAQRASATLLLSLPADEAFLVRGAAGAVVVRLLRMST